MGGINTMFNEGGYQQMKYQQNEIQLMDEKETCIVQCFPVFSILVLHYITN